MPAISAIAPGKIILFGEHAVVYGQPAIAVPISQVKARTVIMADPKGAPGSVRLVAPDIGLDANLEELPDHNPLAATIRGVLTRLNLSGVPACNIRITSTIPIAAGMGSGAAVTVSLIRALSTFLGGPLPDEQVSKLTFEIEKLHHGTPSGIDNSVITYQKPVYYVKDHPIQTLDVSQPFTIVIADTGIHSPTANTVSDVRQAWGENTERYESLFDQIGLIVQQARRAISNGDFVKLGYLMDKNHEYLQVIGVSSPALDGLVNAAKSAGALGAKLSGGGRGGNMIALATPESAEQVSDTLLKEGAVKTLTSQIASTNYDRITK